jgi:hypothetical protein
VLTVIVSLDPIHFVFDGSEADFLRYQRLAAAGGRPSSRDVQNPVSVRLADETDYKHQGRMDFVDNALNPKTGTIRGRAIFENKDGLLTPGYFGRLRLFGGEHEALLVPDSAIASDQASKIVFTVADDGTVGTRRVGLGPIVDGLHVIRSGLAATDRIVIEGLQRRASGAEGQGRGRQDRNCRAVGVSGQPASGAARRGQRPCDSLISSSIGPIFAAVISILLTLVGAIAYRALPITEYPEIAPTDRVVRATFAGASAEVIAQTVAAPIEQEINGVDDMLYLVSQSTGDGALEINVVFKPGTNVDQAQVLVQNRVSVALPRLPEEVQRIGVTVRKSSPDLMLVIHLLSPDDSLDQQYISNYATHQRQGRHYPHRGRRRYDRVRRARLFDAGLARPRPGAGARPHRRRRGGGVARRQRAGGGRRHQPAAGDLAGRVPGGGADARPAVEPRPVRRDHRRHRPGRPGDAGARYRAGGTRLAGLYEERLSRQQGGDRHRHLSAPGLERAGNRGRCHRHDGRARQELPAGPRIQRRLQHHRVHLGNRSTR